MLLRARLTPAGLGLLVGAALAGLAGWALGYAELAVLALAALLVLVAAVATVSVPPRLSVERHVEPPRVARGDLALGLVEVRNLGRRPAAAALATDRVGPLDVAVTLPRLAAGAHRTTTYRLPTRKRGIVTVGPLLVERRDPLGLARAAVARGGTSTFVVHPRVLPLAGLLAGRSRSLEGITAQRAPRGTVTFHALREYVVGDDLRHVHWRSTARTGTLMVKEHIDTSRPETVLLLDSRPSSYDPDGMAFEEAVDVVASLAVACATVGFPVRIVTTDGLRFGGGRPARDPGPLLDRLACVHTREAGDVATACATLTRERAGDTAVVVTGLAQPADLRAVGALRRRFDRTALVSVRADARAAPTPRLHGVATVDADDAPAFASAWARVVGA